MKVEALSGDAFSPVRDCSLLLNFRGNSFLTSYLRSGFPALRQDQLCLRNFEIRGSRCISIGCGKQYKNFSTPNLRCGTTIVETFDLGLLRPLGLPCTDPPTKDKVEDNELFLPSWSFPARRVFPLQILSLGYQIFINTYYVKSRIRTVGALKMKQTSRN